jgi:tRNA modification GTPase
VIWIHPKADLGDPVPADALAVSSLTNEGVPELTQRLILAASNLLPTGDQLALDRRQHEILSTARDALMRGRGLDDFVLVAEELRSAREAVDRISGRAGVEDLLDRLFARFCLGK